MISVIHIVLFGAVFAASFITAYATTTLTIHLAHRFNIIAMSRFGSYVKSGVALLGGIALYSAMLIVIVILWPRIAMLGDIATKHIIGVLLGGLVLVIGGFIDDKYTVAPHAQLIWPILAVVIVMASGIGISYITNPLKPESLIYLNNIQFTVMWWEGVPYHLTFPADLFSFAWLIAVMYATKLQDGLDGLVSGVTLVAALFIFVISWLVFAQLDLAYLAVLFAGVTVGFLYFNRYPARIYLGEGGSLLTGFFLGVLAILSDAKIIITMLILALPIVDAFYTIVRRIKNGVPPWKGDEGHLHHRLIQQGFTHRQAVWLLYSITTLFGVLVLLWQSSFRFYFLGLAFIIVMVICLVFYSVYYRGRMRIDRK